MAVLLRLIRRLSTIPIRIWAHIFVEIDKQIINFVWNYKWPRIVKSLKKDQSRLEWCGYKSRKTDSHQKPAEVQERSSPKASRWSEALVIPQVWTSCFQNCEWINYNSYMSSPLWQFVSAPGKQILKKTRFWHNFTVTPHKIPIIYKGDNQLLGRGGD